jgi:hypothetical protein
MMLNLSFSGVLIPKMMPLRSENLYFSFRLRGFEYSVINPASTSLYLLFINVGSARTIVAISVPIPPAQGNATKVTKRLDKINLGVGFFVGHLMKRTVRVSVDRRAYWVRLAAMPCGEYTSLYCSWGDRSRSPGQVSRQDQSLSYARPA